MPDCPNVRLIIKASKRKGEDHYENYVKNIEALKGMCVGSASACGTASGRNKDAGSGETFLRENENRLLSETEL